MTRISLCEAVMHNAKMTSFCSLSPNWNGKISILFLCPSAWNALQSELKIANLLPLEAFRSIKKKKRHLMNSASALKLFLYR